MADLHLYKLSSILALRHFLLPLHPDSSVFTVKDLQIHFQLQVSRLTIQSLPNQLPPR